MSSDIPGVYFWVYLHDLLQTDMNEHCLTPSKSGASLHRHGSHVAEDLAHNLPVWTEITVICLQNKWGETLDLVWGKVFTPLSWLGEGFLVLDKTRSGGLSGGRLHLSYENYRGEKATVRTAWSHIEPKETTVGTKEQTDLSLARKCFLGTTAEVAFLRKSPRDQAWGLAFKNTAGRRRGMYQPCSFCFLPQFQFSLFQCCISSFRMELPSSL